MSAQEMTALAATAKAKIKATARGWSLVTQQEIVALAFIADLFLEDGEAPKRGTAKPAPNVISET